MKRIILLVGCLVFMAALGFAAQKTLTQNPSQGTNATKTVQPGGAVHPVGACCISGTYKGEKEDTKCVLGHKPEKAKFTMVISQDRFCSANFTAVVTDASGHVTNFSGTVIAGGLGGCCKIEGHSTTGTDNIQIKGSICKSGTKWNAKGTFTTVHCEGNWKMGQI